MFKSATKIKFSEILFFCVLTFFISGCNSTKKQIELVEDVPCEEILKEHFIVNTNAYNITKLVQEEDKLYIFGQVSGCSSGKYSIMWDGKVTRSNPPKISIDFKTYQAGLCDMLVTCIWCVDLSRVKELKSKSVVLHIADTQNEILLEF